MRFPEFSGEWENTTLGDIGTTYNGLSGKNASDFGEGYPYITYKSVFDNERVDLSRTELVAVREGESQNEVSEGDIFFTTSSETPDEVGMASVLLDKAGKCYLNSFCFGFRLNNKSDHLPQFFQFYLRSNIIRRRIILLAQGSTRFNISKNEMLKLGISLPSKEEQTKISAFLKLINTRIATQNKIIEDFKKLRGAIIDKSYKGNAQQEKLGNLIVQQTKRNTALQLNNVLSVNNKLGFISQSDQFEDIVVASSDIRNYKIVMPNDFAYNPARINVGSIARLKDQASGIVSPMYVCFRAKDSISPQYLEYFFETSQCKLAVNKKLEGSVRQCLSFESLCSILITNPKKNEQEEIIRKIDLITKKISILECLSEKYNKEKRYMLQQMFI